jgi:alkylhydroperoxidase family enzyme
MATDAFIKPPKRIPFFIKIGLIVSRIVTKKDLLIPKLLAWYPKVAISSAVLESLVAYGKRDLNERILKLVRIQCSLSVSCSFCIDMNSFEYEKVGISKEEVQELSGTIEPEHISTFSMKERLAIEYAKLISETPIKMPIEFIEKLKSEFTEREIVILSSTAAQVNYWARMIKSLGVPSAGFSDKCEL